MRTGGGSWPGRPERREGRQYPPGFLALLGFFIGDGHFPASGGTPSFRLRKPREISYLHRNARLLGWQVTGSGDTLLPARGHASSAFWPSGATTTRGPR